MTDTESWLQAIAEVLALINRDSGWMPAPPGSTFGNVVDGIVQVVAYRIVAVAMGHEIQVITGGGETLTVDGRKKLTLGVSA